MSENLFQNREHHIYLPKNDKNANCLGEQNFFKSKIWKLHVLMGYWWSNMTTVQRGFSFNIYAAKRATELMNKLDAMGIAYKVSHSGWSIKINVSVKKSNLELIDKYYEEFYKKTIKEHSGWYRYENEIMSKEYKEKEFNNEPESKFQVIRNKD